MISAETSTRRYDPTAAASTRRNDVVDGDLASAAIEYVIDGLNRRVGKKVDGVLVQGWLYGSQLRIAAELDGSGSVTKRFLYGTRTNVPDVAIIGGVEYRVLTDHLGSVRAVVRASDGAVMESRSFDEFGVPLTDTNPGFLPFGFAGGLEDLDTGLVRFGARDLDPETGRWTAKDALRFGGGDTNVFAYVAGDPVNRIDPSGNIAVADDIVVLGVVVIGLSAAGVLSIPDVQQDLANAMGSLTEAIRRAFERARDAVRPFPPMVPREYCDLIPRGQEPPGNESVEIAPDEICDGDPGATVCVYRCPSTLTFQTVELGGGCPPKQWSPWGN